MAVTTALMIGAAAVSAAGSIIQGISENKQAQSNADIYEAQARNIATQQGIVAEQYATKENEVEGSAIVTSARQGIKISGSTAKSISNSIMALQMDNSYQQYNLEVQKQQAYDNARLQREKGKQALMNGFLKAGTSALSAGVNMADSGFFGVGSDSGNSFGTTMQHFKTKTSNKFYDLTHGIKTYKSKYAMNEIG